MKGDLPSHRPCVCAWCEYDNSTGSRFCGNCGRTLVFAVECPFCGAKNPSENAHCDSCGVVLAEAIPKRATHAAYLDRLKPRFLHINWALAALAAIIAFALLIRLVGLTDIPPNVIGDEAENLITVYRIMAGIGPGFFELDWKPQPAFSVYLMGWFMGFFGETIVGMRLPSVALSAASILVFYAVVRRNGLGQPASLGAAFLLSAGLWYLHFSRSGWENVHVGLYALSAMLALNAAIGSKRMRNSLLLFAATGLFAALGLYGYTTGRMIIVALIIYLPIALWLHRDDRKRLLIGYGVMCLTAVILFWPQFDNALDDWEHFNRRVQAVYVLNESNRQRFEDQTGFEIIAEKTLDNVAGFIFLDSRISGVGLNARYIPPNFGLLDRLTAILFWIGLIASVTRWRQTLLWWVFFIVMIFPVQIPGSGSPDAARAAGVAPLFYLFVALTLDLVFSLRFPRNKQILGAAVATILAIIAYINITAYFDWMDDPRSAAARQPAVETADFETWQMLQKAAAEAGHGGFNVGEWLEMKERGF